MTDDEATVIAYVRRFLCKLLGHRQVVVTTCWTSFSTWGWYHCSRCLVDEQFQFDEPQEKPTTVVYVER